jgi:hypothetical protein
MIRNCTNLSVLATLGTLALAATAQATLPPLVINEFNAVNDSNYLGGGGCDTVLTDGDHIVQGNGRNWVEFAVLEDHLDIRGWVLEWANDDPDSGTVTFQNHALWSDLRAGTIIAIYEYDGASGQPSVSDVTIDPCNGDWKLAVRIDNDTYLTHSVSGFKVDNDNWRGQIKDDTNTVIQSWVGESITAGSTGWGDCSYSGNVGNDEVGKLQIENVPGASSVRVCDYDDGDHSTFGCANYWGSGANIKFEIFDDFRDDVCPLGWDDDCDALNPC